MYSRDQIKTWTDKIVDMAKADAVEVTISGGERSGTRWANSAITVNLVQFDRTATVTVRVGQKQGNATTKDFSDAGLKAMVDAAMAEARAANDSTNLPELLGPQEYVPVDAALPPMVNFGPAERARMVKDSIDLAEKAGVLGSGYIPKNDQTTCVANSKGLFAYYRAAEAGFVLTCRTPDGGASGWSGITGVKDLGLIDAKALTDVAAGKALKARKPKKLEPGRYTVILEPRANARFLSLMTGVFGGGFPGGAPGGDTPAPEGGAPPAGEPAAAPPGGGAAGRAGGAGRGGGAGGRGGGGGGRGGGRGGALAGKNVGDKIFSDLFTLKSDIGNPILRQTPILANNRPAHAVTWVENGIWKTAPANAGGTTVNMSLMQAGSDLSIADMIKQTRRGLLVTFFWYIRGVPSDDQPLLNTGMTRDGLFLIENGEITTPVWNFRWNMSPLVGYNNLTLVGKPVPIHTGESYDGGGTALVPPVRIEDFYMTSVSPAV